MLFFFDLLLSGIIFFGSPVSDQDEVPYSSQTVMRANGPEPGGCSAGSGCQ